ncbi:inositol monophosphatase family protein [Acetobacter sp. AN02]|uniref:inositol monophosphatase family protein n=1 Tax=Acetobacter sp. AN02 TaxID=2894186 RepID=UPI002434294F|nr:inositol monophosphatase family protein [Acetobacter sp. AN02]MDG6093942.1 inositol monophosphatase family protein [Acetobacter sp. AN02]
MTPDQTESCLKTALMLADIAGAVIRPLFRAPLHADNKADASPVTVADRGAERVMRAFLEELHPDHGILGEEFGRTNADSPFCWTLDPVDGTRAFITGRPVFGTLIALMYENRPVIGIIDQPVTGERWIGVAGRETLFRPAMWHQDRTPLPAAARPCPSLGDAELSCTSPEMLESAPECFTWATLKQACRRVSWGGDCYAYGLLALGQIDIIAECDMKPWDWAALQPVVEGAGGCMTDWSGKPLDFNGDGTVLAVGNRDLLDKAVTSLKTALH